MSDFGFFPESGDGFTLPGCREIDCLRSILSEISANRKAGSFAKPSKPRRESNRSPFSDCSHLLLLDGSVHPQTQVMGVGIVAVDPAEPKSACREYAYRPMDRSGEPFRGTSPVAELVGLCLAIRMAADVAAADPTATVGIATDSQNSVNWFTGSYQIKEDHIRKLVELARAWANGWVDESRLVLRKAHRDLTAPADTLARRACGLSDRPEESEPMSLDEFDRARERGGIPAEAKVRVVP
jgi:ribonuclease HI